jgi:hypothetical protein
MKGEWQMPDQIERIATALLELAPDPVPRYIIMRDFLAYRYSQHELSEAKTNSVNSSAFQNLVARQLPDGSWGDRFHYTGTKVRNASISTESAITRLQALGADRESEVMQRSVSHMEQILMSDDYAYREVNLNVKPGKAMKLIVATRLRELVPDHPLALAYAEKLLLIINHSFAFGYFDETSFAEATEDVMGTRLSTDCEICFSIYPLILLKGLVEYDLEKLWIHHIIHNRRGINFLNNRSVKYLPLSFPSAESTRYLSALHYLLLYPSATEYLAESAEWLWNQASYEGFWDLGNIGKDGLILPLSQNWRRPVNRLIDSSIRVLSILKRFQTSCSIRESICHPI